MSVTNSIMKLNNGFSMPVLGLGTWKSQAGQVENAVEYALKSGYRHLDCAAIYRNEIEVGTGISASGVPRSEIFVTSKLWWTKHHPDDVEPACRKTLADLGLSYLDLYLIHWPTAFGRGDDPDPKNADGTPRYETISPTETYLAMEKLVGLGLVRSIGLSNFNSEQISDILEKGSIKPVTNQVECHPFLNQSKLLSFCKERDVTITAYAPLGSPDCPWRKPDDFDLLDDPRIKKIGEKHNKSTAQVLIRWQIQRGAIVIPKSVTPSRIDENAAVFDFNLTKEDMEMIDSFDCNGRLFPGDAGHPHNPHSIEF